VIEARHVDVGTSDTVVVVNFAADKLRSEAADGEADLFGEIAPDYVGRIADAIGVTRGGRV
jgi:hypothetical protein